jgi:threonine aldolase
MTSIADRKPIDLRSDTVTLPSLEMREAMASADVGDDFYREDPTLAELEETAASMLGKASALFVPSGTMGNLLAHLAHCPGGAEVIAPEPAHSFSSEAGGPSRVAGMTLRAISQCGGELDLIAYRRLIRSQGLLTQPTGLLWVEQPTRGFVVPIEQLRELREIADQHGLPIHMDGARIFNAAIATGLPAADIAAFADTVMFCMSKGLAAPIGSLLAGPADFIARARSNRQMLGGGMRQAGIMAAAGLYALRHNIERLAEDHANARRLADGLASLPGLRLDRGVVETNIFFVESDRENLSVQELARALREYGVLVNVPAPSRRTVRFVTHYGVSAEDIEQALSVAAAVLGAKLATESSAATRS